MPIREQQGQEDPEQRCRGQAGPEAEPGHRFAPRQRARSRDDGMDRVFPREVGDREQEGARAEDPADRMPWIAAEDERADHEGPEEDEQLPGTDERRRAARGLEHEAGYRQHEVERRAAADQPGGGGGAHTRAVVAPRQWHSDSHDGAIVMPFGASPDRSAARADGSTWPCGCPSPSPRARPRAASPPASDARGSSPPGPRPWPGLGSRAWPRPPAPTPA